MWIKLKDKYIIVDQSLIKPTSVNVDIQLDEEDQKEFFKIDKKIIFINKSNKYYQYDSTTDKFIEINNESDYIYVDENSYFYKSINLINKIEKIYKKEKEINEIKEIFYIIKDKNEIDRYCDDEEKELLDYFEKNIRNDIFINYNNFLSDKKKEKKEELNILYYDYLENKIAINYKETKFDIDTTSITMLAGKYILLEALKKDDEFEFPWKDSFNKIVMLNKGDLKNMLPLIDESYTKTVLEQKELYRSRIDEATDELELDFKIEFIDL